MFPHLCYRISVRSLCLVVTSLCLIGFVSAQRGNLSPNPIDPSAAEKASILGTVFFPSGQRADKRVRVRLQTPTIGDKTTMTDDNGKFSFRSLAAGSYTVVIDDEKDFETVAERVDIIATPPRNSSTQEQIFTVQIRLKLKGASESRPAVMNAELANVPKQALNFYTKALDLARAGNSKGAVEQLQHAVSEYPAFMLAFNELGVQYLRLNELEKANESLKSALKLQPDAVAPLMNHGMVLVHMNKFAEAEPELRSALKQKEQSATGHYYLGLALANLRRFDEAEKELATAVTLGGDDMKDAHRYLGAIFNAQGDKAHAIAEFETYLRLAPKAQDAERIKQIVKQLKASDKP